MSMALQASLLKRCCIGSGRRVILILRFLIFVLKISLASKNKKILIFEFNCYELVRKMKKASLKMNQHNLPTRMHQLTRCIAHTPMHQLTRCICYRESSSRVLLFVTDQGGWVVRRNAAGGPLREERVWRCTKRIHLVAVWAVGRDAVRSSVRSDALRSALREVGAGFVVKTWGTACTWMKHCNISLCAPLGSERE